MRRISQSELHSLLVAVDGPPVKLVVAPNYEPRSALAPLSLLGANPLPTRVTVHIWTLRSKSVGVAPLEDLKHDNIAAVKSFLDREQRRATQTTIAYPDDFNSTTVGKELDRILSELAPGGCLIIDISPMPRRLLGVITNWWLGKPAGEREHRLAIAYAWAASYPRHPTDEGEWRLLETDEPLARAVDMSAMEHVECLIVCGRQGFDAASLVDSLGPNLSAVAYVLLSRVNLHHSLEVVRANLQTLRARRVSLRYCLSVEAGHEHIMKWAATVPVGPGFLSIVAPLGPKPFVLSALMATELIQKRTKEAGSQALVGGVVSLSGHRYNNVYSLGFVAYDLFEFHADTV